MEFWSFFKCNEKNFTFEIKNIYFSTLIVTWIIKDLQVMRPMPKKLEIKKKNHSMIPQIYFLKFDFWTKTPCQPWIYVVIISYNCIFTLNLNSISHKTWWCGTRMWNIHENISRKIIWITWKSLNIK